MSTVVHGKAWDGKVRACSKPIVQESCQRWFSDGQGTTYCHTETHVVNSFEHGLGVEMTVGDGWK